MRMPASPPNHLELIRRSAGRIFDISTALHAHHRPGLNYLHWDDLRRRRPPAGLTSEEWWLGLKLGRTGLLRGTPLRDPTGRAFNYLVTDSMLEQLHRVDTQGGGHLRSTAEPGLTPDSRDQYYIRSLMEEAITSSILEGAHTTRRAAEKMIRENRRPRNKSEKMVLNNFMTMKRIEELVGDPLTPEVVFEIHELITRDTFEDPTASGRFRQSDEDIVVGDLYGEIFHRPPPAGELESRMIEMCRFANKETPTEFLHPVLRSIFLHFWLAYDHPFVDGNGRTARALFYWSMLKSGYWLCAFISISQVILRAPIQYGRAFLLTETDDLDLTYFAIYHLDVIRKALDNFHEYIERKTRDLRAVEKRLKGIKLLNHRQQDLMRHALRHPGTEYTFQSHQSSQGVVYQTARTDLLDLASRGLLVKRKVAKSWRFEPAPDLERRLSTLPDA